MSGLGQEEKIKAVLTRDANYDGLFVYGVKSTGIYCRSSCPSRRPKPENMEFFDTPVNAENAGYRACLRCKPSEYHNPNEVFVEKIINYITENLDEKITLNRLAEEFKVSKYHLQRTFKSILGLSPRQYIETRRLEQFKDKIRTGETVDSAMYSSGFSSRSRLYAKVPLKLDMTPTEYREGGVEVTIRYSIFDTSITKVLVARTQKGVCALYMGEVESYLVESLEKEFPYGELIRDDVNLSDIVETVTDYFEGRDFNPRLPLDIHRTAFQWKVLQAIQEIPPGQTKTYSELAESIGKPKAVRAVASACGKNPVSILIPCHRVLRKNGEMGGYRWGVPLKRGLLQHENVILRDKLNDTVIGVTRSPQWNEYPDRCTFPCNGLNINTSSMFLSGPFTER